MVSGTSAHIPIQGRQISGLCRRYHLREDFHPDSDVDVLVAFEPEAHIGFVALSRMQRELSALFQRQVDLVPMDGLKPIIREEVLSSAQDVYAENILPMEKQKTKLLEKL